MDLSRIEKMEACLNECTAATKALNEQLDGVEALGDAAADLFAYYGSESWYRDREGTLPEGVAAGVLSEDLVYDQITELRDTAFRMLRLATDMLQNWI